VSAAISQPDPVVPADHESSFEPELDGPDPAGEREEAPAGAVVVRRNAGLAALVGAAASAVAIAYLWRATQSGAPLDWALCVVMATIGATYLANLVDARTPLLVADDLGLRVRLGHQWRGLPWDAVGSVAVQPRRGWRDGRLMFAPHSLGRALDGLDARGRRAAATNQRVYGAALAVPVGLTTRLSVPTGGLVERLELLAHGRAEVVLMPAADPETSPRPDEEREPLRAAAGEDTGQDAVAHAGESPFEVAV
jgi:cytoskeleton protein RodZ